MWIVKELANKNENTSVQIDLFDNSKIYLYSNLSHSNLFLDLFDETIIVSEEEKLLLSYTRSINSESFLLMKNLSKRPFFGPPEKNIWSIKYHWVCAEPLISQGNLTLLSSLLRPAKIGCACAAECGYISQGQSPSYFNTSIE